MPRTAVAPALTLAAPGACYAVKLQPCREAQERAPVPAPGHARSLSLCSSGFFQHLPPGVRVPPAQEAAWQRWQSVVAVGASGCRLPAGAALGGFLKKHLALT